MEKTLGELLSDPRIEKIVQDAICKRDLTKEDVWNKTLQEIRDHFFRSDIGRGMKRLYQAANTGEWYYPLYTEAECAENPDRTGVNLVWLPSGEEGADDRPFILLVPGGGFVNVWNLTEGWPVAAQFNDLGYHVFVLTYQVDGNNSLLEKNMEDFARALRFISKNEAKFHVRGDRYITCGFSAGGYLICLWNTGKGFIKYNLPKPQACFPIYPGTSMKIDDGEEEAEPEDMIALYGCSYEEAAASEYEIPEHAELFPPSAIFLAADDELVDPRNSRMLASALDRHQIPCRLEIGPDGGHGFADGTGMCMAGWTERAVKWYESLEKKA